MGGGGKQVTKSPNWAHLNRPLNQVKKENHNQTDS